MKTSVFDEQTWIREWWLGEGRADACDVDVTTGSLLGVLPGLRRQPVTFVLLAKSPGVFSGRSFLDWIGEHQSSWNFEKMLKDGAPLAAGENFLRGGAELSELLSRERMLLNMLQHLSGIATATAQIVEMVKNCWKFSAPQPEVLHTRKFLPGLRHWQAEACLHGGGASHRLNLGDRILFKDNHKKFLLKNGSTLSAYYAHLLKNGSIKSALIEVETVDEALGAVNAGVENLLLDNFKIPEIGRFFKLLPRDSKISIELSGNLTKDSLPGLLVDSRIRRLSFGAITHSVKALDISLEIIE
jgi:nicotinate-nucleotide pyrophosphorylase (carboxylating)